MLIPSIDLMGGRIVQLVQGEKLKLAFDDFEYWIARFSAYPLVQLIDLDAAMRQGDNRALIEMICKRLPCQVGGGLKTAEDGRRLLDLGAKRVIFGSSLFGPEPAGVRTSHSSQEAAMNGAPGESAAMQTQVSEARPGAPGFFGAEPGGGAEAVQAHVSESRHGASGSRRHAVIRLEFAEELKAAVGEDALCFAVDTKGGRVAVKGWKDSVDLTPEEAVTWLEDCCAAFLYTHVDREGTMQGFPIDVAAILRACTAKQLIVAGGIKERAEVDALDAMGVDAVAGMAVYSGAMEA